MWLLAMLEFGTMWFWLLFVVLSLCFVYALEIESAGAATFGTFLFLSLLGVAFRFNPGPWILGHPGQFAGAIVGWFVAGTLWGIVKWWFYIHNVARRYKHALAEFNKLYPGARIPQQPGPQYSRWSDLKRVYGLSLEIPPKVARNKGRILMWMTWWPWSLTWTVINDPVRRIFKSIYYAIGDHLQAISNNAFKSIIVESKTDDPGNG